MNVSDWVCDHDCIRPIHCIVDNRQIERLGWCRPVHWAGGVGSSGRLGMKLAAAPICRWHHLTLSSTHLFSLWFSYLYCELILRHSRGERLCLFSTITMFVQIEFSIKASIYSIAIDKCPIKMQVSVLNWKRKWRRSTQASWWINVIDPNLGSMILIHS